MEGGLEAVVVGTGFGGAIAACRLSKRWPGKVLVLERGKRYPMGSFPRSPRDFSRNFWNLCDEKRERPAAMQDQEQHGLFDIRNFQRMDAVVAAGLGGGSLIYANVFLEPPEHVFDERWPASCKKATLAYYYGVAKEVLGSRPVPLTGDPRRKIVRTELFQEVAREMGRESRLVDINVFFGDPGQPPLPIGQQARNRYGALQTSCVYCAECDVGCNTHSKNTLDLNYLHVAETRYQADVRTEHLVERIVPVNERGEDDPAADGSRGYRVSFADLGGNGRTRRQVWTRRVLVCAGTLGSTELLLRARDLDHTLPRVSPKLGQQFSGNGDFLSFVFKGRRAADPNYGPVITQRTDFNLFEDFDRERAFILEDASYPSFAAWFSEAIQPGPFWLKPIWHSIRDTAAQLFGGKSAGRVGIAFSDLIGDADISYKTSVLLCMGLDRSNGRMFLGQDGHIDVDWPRDDNRALYDAILAAGERFKEKVGAEAFFALPNWWRPFRRNVTVHALGGCALGDSEGAGVTSAAPETFGQVFGYTGLYVSDGSMVPTAVGANPTATIAALGERVAEGITGLRPDAEL